jgi:hypothetical protein
MPEHATAEKAERKLRQGRAPSTAAGEFVREEIHHVREGKHGARSPKQAIAIGLSKARRAGVPLKPPKRQASARTRRAAERDLATGQHRRRPRRASSKRRRSAGRALAREPRRGASHDALSRQARAAAKRRSASARRAAARKAARTKGPAMRRASAQKAARTRRRQASST